MGYTFSVLSGGNIAFLREEGGTRQGFPEANEMSFGGSLRSVTEGECESFFTVAVRYTHQGYTPTRIHFSNAPLPNSHSIRHSEHRTASPVPLGKICARDWLANPNEKSLRDSRNLLTTKHRLRCFNRAFSLSYFFRLHP